MLSSTILAGNARLENAAAGGVSVKRAPPADDVDAVRRIQTALVELGFNLPFSFMSGTADGKFGDETYRAVLEFQRAVFPKDPSQWDGRVGKNTLGKMDEMLTDEPAAVNVQFIVAGTSEEKVEAPSPDIGLA